MKTTLSILCVIYVISAGGADKIPSEKKTSLTDIELRTLATSVPDTKTASMLHSVAMATSNNIDLRQEYLKAAAACLIACDKKDIYVKHIKSKLLNVEEFESGLKDDCKQCSGEGTKDRRCTVCNGKGKCTSCKGSGRTASYGFDRPKEWKPCRKCNGSGQCGKCNGEGVLKEKCMACAGTGKALSKTVATRVYRDSCKEIADAIASGVKANVGTRGIANAEEEENVCKSSMAGGLPPIHKSEAFDGMVSNASRNGLSNMPHNEKGESDVVIQQFDAEKNTCGRVVRHGVQLWAGGPCWATTNIGADEPWDYGYYFWWGDTVGYKRENDNWVASDGLSSASGFSFGMTSTTTDDKSISKLKSDGWITEDDVLAPVHDAAQVQWGGGWRMPTRQELTDLWEKCDWNWTTKNGVNGYDIYGRGDYASAGIFLPCAGEAHIDRPRYVGAQGVYWSSVPSSSSTSSSWGFYFSGPRDFDSGARDTCKLDRIYGRSIRPVNKKSDKQDTTFASHDKINKYRTAAEHGDAGAQFELGQCYAKGEGVDKDMFEATKWYRKAAEQGHADAQYNLGMSYARGEGVERKMAEAVKWYRKSAEQGSPDAQFSLGMHYWIGNGVEKDMEEAVKWYRKSAEQGFPDAQVMLGLFYEVGSVVEKDMEEAVKWYRKAAEQAIAVAQLKLAICYIKGEGIETNMPEAVKWLRRAAKQGQKEAKAILQKVEGLCPVTETSEEQDPTFASHDKTKKYRKAAEHGDAEAQFELGRCYAKGNGVSKDMSEATKWYRKAAEQGHAGAQYSFGVCRKDGVGVPENVYEGAEWILKAAEQGVVEAQLTIGWLYAKGEGVDRDMASAARWYRKAAAQGLAEAQYELGRCYHEGAGVSKDINEALDWYRKAAVQNEQRAQFELGLCYGRGDGVYKNEVEAAKWFGKAAKLGHVGAQFFLGLGYLGGRGVPKDKSEAIYWLEKAKDNGSAEAQKVLNQITDIP